MADGLTAGTTSLIACSSPLVVAAIGAASGWERLRPAAVAGHRPGRPRRPGHAGGPGRPPAQRGLPAVGPGRPRRPRRRHHAPVPRGPEGRGRRGRVRGGRRRVRGACGLGAARRRCRTAAERVGRGVLRLARRGRGSGCAAAPVRAGPAARGDGCQQPPVRRPRDHRVGRVAAAGHPARSPDRGGPGDRGGGTDADHGPAGRPGPAQLTSVVTAYAAPNAAANTSRQIRVSSTGSRRRVGADGSGAYVVSGVW